MDVGWMGHQQNVYVLQSVGIWYFIWYMAVHVTLITEILKIIPAIEGEKKIIFPFSATEVNFYWFN